MPVVTTFYQHRQIEDGKRNKKTKNKKGKNKGKNK
jgi:hypothetical protein